MQSRNVLLPVLFGVMIIGLFGAQDAYAVLPSLPLFTDAQEKSSDRIDFTWTEPAAGAPILSYNIYVESPNGTPFATIPVISTGGTQTYQHMGLTPETPYYYEVAAINAEGEGLLSVSVSTETLSPGIMVTVIDEDTCFEIGDEFGGDMVWEDPNTCRLESGAINIDLGDELIIPAGIIFAVDPGAMIFADGIITIEGGGQFDNSGTIIADEIQNSGTVNNLVGGTMTVESFFNSTPGELNNSGTFTVITEIINSIGATITNDNVFQNNSIITNFGELENNASFINDGEISSSGSIKNELGTFTNNNLVSTTGTFTNSNSGLFNNNSNFVILSSVVNTASIQNLAGTITVGSTGSVDTTSGTFDNSSIIINQGGSIDGAITGDNPPVDQNPPSITIEDPDTFVFTTQDSIAFLASGSDLNGFGQLNSTILNFVSWTYTIDSTSTEFGTGATATTSLNPGTYLITASIDDGNNISTSQITLEISGFDGDGDGYPAAGPGVTGPIDCDDTDNTTYPGAFEIIADGIDQDCNTEELCYVDSDMDMYGNDDESTVVSVDLFCEYADGESDNKSDCDDTTNAVNPGIEEVFGNGIDDNCNDMIDEGFTDNDEDGHAFPADCDDNNNTVYPGASEILDNKDNDCNGFVDDNLDIDGDGYFTGDDEDPNTDCNDDPSVIPGTNPELTGFDINPGAIEIEDGVDNNCDDLVDNIVEQTLDIPITQSSDDAEQDKSKMDLDSSDLDLNEKNYVGLRFQNVEIPAGSTVTNAYVQFTTQDDKDTGRAKVKIYAQDSDDTQTFTTTKKDISSRPTTSANVNWTIPDWIGMGTAGTEQQTPDITSLVQEVVDRNGWTDGNSITIIIKERYGNDRDAVSYDANPTKAAVLHVEFTPGTISTNFVANGNFETPTVSDHNGDWELFSDGTSGLEWTVTGGPLELQHNILGGSFEGQQHAELDGTGSVTLSQTLNTVSGDTYDLSFAYKARPNTDAATNGLQVTWNGVDVAPGITLTDSWQTITVQVTGNGNDILAFTDVGISDSYGTFVDNVAVTTSN